MAPSREHEKTALRLLSVKLNVALVVLTKAAGDTVITGVGVRLGGPATAADAPAKTTAEVTANVIKQRKNERPAMLFPVPHTPVRSCANRESADFGKGVMRRSGGGRLGD